jgi:hypothetical protein
MPSLNRLAIFLVAATMAGGAGILLGAAPTLGKAKQAKQDKHAKDEATMPDKANRLKHLTPMQLNVTQQCGTEPPFQNAYWDNHREGIYVDVVSGEPLFR